MLIFPSYPFQKFPIFSLLYDGDLYVYIRRYAKPLCIADYYFSLRRHFNFNLIEKCVFYMITYCYITQDCFVSTHKAQDIRISLVSSARIVRRKKRHIQPFKAISHVIPNNFIFKRTIFVFFFFSLAEISSDLHCDDHNDGDDDDDDDVRVHSALESLLLYRMC